jgi:hypothetical protein
MTPGYNLDVHLPQPAVSGLGAVNSSWDTGEGVFRPGGYGGGVFDGNISGLGSIGARRRIGMRGLGEDSADYPWKAYSDKTKALQVTTNESLKKAGLCPIAADGKLGGATCGARNHLSVNSEKYFGQLMDFANPSACDAHVNELVRPKSASTGCGANVLPVPSSSIPQPVVEAGMSSSSKRALGFAIGGILAIGAVVMLRKKHG